MSVSALHFTISWGLEKKYTPSNTFWHVNPKQNPKIDDRTLYIENRSKRSELIYSYSYITQLKKHWYLCTFVFNSVRHHLRTRSFFTWEWSCLPQQMHKVYAPLMDHCSWPDKYISGEAFIAKQWTNGCILWMPRGLAYRNICHNNFPLTQFILFSI